MYIRFVYAKTVQGMRSREGFFQAAGEFADNPLSDVNTVARVDVLREWFAKNLPLPGQFSRNSTKRRNSSETKGLSWFKPSATEHISRAFELKSILDECGYTIDILKEKRIGYVIYEDEYQIVAEPFADMNT